ncbi:hypothetical protein [Stratiformator vulcanicus]|uniref:Uncharacterized protein n=1 Tax=Stratiformator vulcanicus TaxID=2527980 RepID=A0A517QZV3_9PLAN|nr:hypothetical protein [Stratiformator vulcanicus]QDT37123.1 hypothetical protein Pan189_14910 [Stratiformator vulcanicus]
MPNTFRHLVTSIAVGATVVAIGSDTQLYSEDLADAIPESRTAERLFEQVKNAVMARQGDRPEWQGKLPAEVFSDWEKERLEVVLKELKEDQDPDGWNLRGDVSKVRYKMILPDPREANLRGFHGMWLMTLAADYERPVFVYQVTPNVVSFRTGGVIGGLYHIQGDRWVMLIPTDKRMSKHEWKVLNANVVLMTKSSTDAGPDYSGATLSRIIDLDQWPRYGDKSRIVD